MICLAFLKILEINDAEMEIHDSSITDAEMKDAIKTLKNNKTCGIDNIENEHIKYSYPLLKNIHLKLFNLIFEKRVIPEAWDIGIINPIYKKKAIRVKPKSTALLLYWAALGSCSPVL